MDNFVHKMYKLCTLSLSIGFTKKKKTRSMDQVFQYILFTFKENLAGAKPLGDGDSLSCAYADKIKLINSYLLNKDNPGTPFKDKSARFPF